MGTLYQRPNSPCYWATYYDGTGKRVRATTRTADKEEAKRFLKLREGAVAKEAPVPPRLDRVTFDELRDNLMAYYRTTEPVEAIGTCCASSGRISASLSPSRSRTGGGRGRKS